MQLISRSKYFSGLIINHECNFVAKAMANFIGEKVIRISGKSTKYQMYKKLFINYTNMKTREIKSLLFKHNEIFLIDINQISNNLRICKSENINLSLIENNYQFLHLNENDLINRIMLLKEMGATFINTAMINSTVRYVPVMLFKTYAGISSDVNIAKILYSHLHKPPPEVPPLENLSEDLTVMNYRRKCLDHYLRWRFQLINVNDSVMKNWTLKCNYRTFSNIKLSFDLLHHDGKMPIEMIWRHQCLLKCSVKDLSKIFQEIETICSVPIPELLNKEPALHEMKYLNVLLVKNHLEKYQITGEQVKNCPKVLLMKPKMFLKAWRTLLGLTDSEFLLKHPMILRCLIVREGLHKRIKYLNYLNLSDIMVDVLKTSFPNFERSVRCGSFRNRGKEICTILSSNFGINRDRIKTVLSAHPLWRQANSSNMFHTLIYLKEQFDMADIEKNLCLILYPRDKVKPVLENLINSNKLMDETDQYTPSQLLALCVYEIEKKFNFSGDGIWGECKPGKSSNTSDEDHNQVSNFEIKVE